jgi:hypothetical protein
MSIITKKASICLQKYILVFDMSLYVPSSPSLCPTYMVNRVYTLCQPLFGVVNCCNLIQWSRYV